MFFFALLSEHNFYSKCGVGCFAALWDTYWEEIFKSPKAFTSQVACLHEAGVRYLTVIFANKYLFQNLSSIPA